jgi:hypothetical protein
VRPEEGAVLASWWHAYWGWAGSNIGAMPAEFIITVIVTVVFQKPIGRLLAWVRQENRQALRKAQADAEAARVIAADLYRHVTGEEHPARSGE